MSSAAPLEARLEEHYGDLATQTHAARLGMWIFLASEVLLFTGLFAVYFAYRAEYAAEFKQAAKHTDLLLGSADTVILICASFLVALGVREVRQGRSGRTEWLLWGAVALGALFEILKGTEYLHHFSEGIYPGAYYQLEALPTPGANAFFTLYFLMTGLHALHVAGGMAVLAWLAVGTRRGAYTPGYHTPLELGGMYWHLVDVIWVFLWPMFYLLR